MISGILPPTRRALSNHQSQFVKWSMNMGDYLHQLPTEKTDTDHEQPTGRRSHAPHGIANGLKKSESL